MSGPFGFDYVFREGIKRSGWFGLKLETYQDHFTWAYPFSPFHPWISEPSDWADYASAVMEENATGPVRVFGGIEVLLEGTKTKPVFDGIERNRWLLWLNPCAYVAQLSRFLPGRMVEITSLRVADVGGHSAPSHQKRAPVGRGKLLAGKPVVGEIPAGIGIDLDAGVSLDFGFDESKQHTPDIFNGLVYFIEFTPDGELK